MAKYTVISDIGYALTNILRSKLTPEPIDKAEKIGICEPKNRGEYIVGIHPYDIKEDLNSQQIEPIKLPDGREQDPPSMLELYYMISVCSKAEFEVKSAEESRIIGKIIQVFKDNRTIPPEFFPENSKIESIPVNMLPLEMEEKVKIWTMFGESYKLSVFYLVGPVAIDSEVIRKPQKRVETFVIGTSQKIPRKIVQFETRIKEEDIDDEYTADYKNDEDEDSDDDFGDDSDDSDDFGDDESDDESNDSDNFGGDEFDDESSDDSDDFGDDEFDDESFDDLDDLEDDNKSNDEASEDLDNLGDDKLGNESSKDSDDFRDNEPSDENPDNSDDKSDNKNFSNSNDHEDDKHDNKHSGDADDLKEIENSKSNDLDNKSGEDK